MTAFGFPQAPFPGEELNFRSALERMTDSFRRRIQDLEAQHPHEEIESALVVASSAGPFPWDYYVQEGYVGVEGAEYTVFGHTFAVYSTPTGAIDAADATNDTKAILVGPGTYENITIPSTFASGDDLYVYGVGQRDTVIGSATSGNALTISSGSPTYHFKGINFRGAVTGYSILGDDTNIAAWFEDCEFDRKVSADFAGAGFRRCKFDLGYTADTSGHSPSTVTFVDCDMGSSAATWSQQVQEHYFNNCIWGSSGTITVTSDIDDVNFVNCELNGRFRVNGASASVGSLKFIGCKFASPPDADGIIWFELHGGMNGVSILGNNFSRTLGSTNAYITSDDTQTEGVVILGNNFDRDGSGNYVEDSGGVSVSGNFTESIFGPNSPGLIARYDITGANNEFYPTSSATGSSTVPADHNLLSLTHGDTVANAVTRGSLIYGNSTPAWDELTIGASGRVLTSDGTDVAWSTHNLLSATHGDTVVQTASRGSIIVGNSTPAWTELILGALGSNITNVAGDVGWAGLHAPSAVTISSDLFVYATPWTVLTSESGTSDDCTGNTIVTASGTLLIVSPAAGHTITLKHDSAPANVLRRFKNHGDVDIVMSDSEKDFVVYAYDLTGAFGIGWIEQWRSENLNRTHIRKDFLDAKGDIISASAADTPALLTVGSDRKILEAASGEATGLVWRTNERQVAIVVEDPTSSEDIDIGFVFSAITIQEIQAVVVGSSTPSVTINPKHSTDRSAAGNAILSSATAITNTTTGQNLTSFTDATVPADSHIWLETTAKSGTVDSLAVTIRYTFD